MISRPLADAALVLALALPLAFSTAALAGDAADEGSFWWSGRSGKLRVALTEPGASIPVPRAALAAEARYRWVDAVTGATSAPGQVVDGAVPAPATVGAWRLELASEAGAAFRAEEKTVVTRRHFDNAGTHLNGYHIGRHPGRGRKGEYAPPERFIEVTEAMRDLNVSESFRLGQFLTKDQGKVWPKYVPLDARLLDKLELIVAELRAEGIAARKVHVMSGYRTPQYNGPGGRGRAKFSRHTYGDAADIWVDDDGDGRMDDLNRDGRVDDRDAAFLARIAARVEEKHPELAGGAGIYKSRPNRGPFTHIDVRGRAARWSRL